MNAMSIALGLFDMGYVCSMVIAAAILGSVSGVALGTWLSAECAGFLLARVAIDNWRYFSSFGESTSLSLGYHLAMYLMMLAAPFPNNRTPHVLSPSIYAGFILWTLFGANPLKLALVYYCSFDDQPKLDWQTAATVLAASTAVCMIGAAFALKWMDVRFRSTFYKHYTLAKYVREYDWNERTTLKLRGQIITGCDQELVRAKVMQGFARCYWPMDLVKPFVRDNWCVSFLAVAGESLA